MMYQVVFMEDSYFAHSRIWRLKRIRPDFAVEVLLYERLEKIGVNPFTTYLTTLVDLVGHEVSESRTLFDETLDWVEKESIPNYVQGISEVFDQRFSFDSKYRVKGLGLIEFEKIVIDIVRWLTDAPSVNLSKRAINVSGIEEVHAALKYGLLEIDIDSVYVTRFVKEPGGRRISQSRRLAEDVFAHFEYNQIPYYRGEEVGVYSIAYSDRESDLHPQLDIKDIRNLVIEVAPDFLN